MSFWCVDRADFERFAAYNALYYLGVNAPRGLSAPGQTEIPGGMKTYVDALVGELRTHDGHDRHRRRSGSRGTGTAS